MGSRFHFAAFAVLAIALVGGLAGCGSDGSTTMSLTKAQFIRQADRICARADEKQEELSLKFSSKKPEEGSAKDLQVQIVREVGLPPLKEEVEELRALGAPDGDGDQVEDLVISFEDALAEAEEDPLSMGKEPNGPFAEANRLATAYGLKDCADGA